MRKWFVQVPESAKLLSLFHSCSTLFVFFLSFLFLIGKNEGARFPILGLYAS